MFYAIASRRLADYQNNMSDESQPQQHIEVPSHLLRQRRRRWPLVLLFLVVLALVGVGGVYMWANIGTFVQSFAREAPDNRDDAGDKAALPDLLAIQQKISDDLETLSKAVADQQEQLKTVVDQLAALASKVDALERPAVPVQIPPPMAAPARSLAPIAEAAAKPKKPTLPRTPKPAGPISTGGAPLNAASEN
jgi:uncharacterized coiled-coil protein SlyX